MQRPDNRVVLAGMPSAYTITAMPQGVMTTARGFAHGLRMAENLVRERSCAFFNDTDHKPLSGDYGPSHLVGNPRIFVIYEAGEWIVCVSGRPDLERCFIGPAAENSAHKHGRKLFNACRDMALAEQARRDRIKSLRRTERAETVR